MMSSLIACCWRYFYCLRHFCFFHPDCGRHSCCCWRPFSSWWFPVVGVPAIADVPGGVGVSAVPFEHAVAGGPVVTGFPAVDGVLSVASIPVDHGVTSLANGFTYRTLQCTMRHIRLSDYGHRTIIFSAFGISNIGFAVSNYQLSEQRLNRIGLSCLRKNYWLPTSVKCTASPLQLSARGLNRGRRESW